MARNSKRSLTTVSKLPPKRWWLRWDSSLPTAFSVGRFTFAGAGAHTGDLVHFEDLRGARVLIVGGRQSAYEWAALIGKQGAERIDIVHRHDVPLFERVSWKFVDDYVDSMLAVPGWWRRLSHSERERIARQFWEVGRLTLEWWLIHASPGTSSIVGRAHRSSTSERHWSRRS